MRLLAVSDLHLDAGAAEALLSVAGAADLVVVAGDLATQHEGLAEYAARLEPVAAKTIMVPGNNESLDALRAATSATVLHGQGAESAGLTVAGLGGGVPPLPPSAWESWDLTEEEAATLLAPLDRADLLVCHSPPAGLGDNHAQLGHIGSAALKAAMLRLAPRLCVFGHVHDCWGASGAIGGTEWRNLGPNPVWFEL